MVVESLMFWLAVGSYALASLLAIAAVTVGRGKLAAVAWWLTMLALAFHTGSIAVRWWASGRLPYVQDYENLLAGTWFIVLAFALIGLKRPRLRVMGAAVLPLVLLTLGYAITLPSHPGVVTPAYKSAWLVVHVTFAWATYAAYTTAAGLAVAQLLRMRKRGVTEGSPLAKLPPDDHLVQTSARLVGFGFLVNGVMIASGAVWAYELWGAYWSWDPVEVWSLLTWIAYGFYLHAHLTLGWSAKRLAWVAVLALFGVMMAFWGVQLFPSSYHLFRSLGEAPVQARP